MDNKGLIQTMGWCVFTLALSSCSSNPVNTTAGSKEVKRAQVYAATIKTPKVDATYKLKTPETKPSSVALVSRKSGKTQQYYINKYKAEQRRKKYAAIHQARKKKARQQFQSGSRNHAVHYKATSAKKRYAALRGDYAGNPQTIAFINKMVNKYGFDRGYLNYLFSNTKATPFLKRMAYADAYGRKNKNKNPRPGRWTRYRGNFLTEKTISKGIQFWRSNRVALQRAEDRYGVPQEYILGIIGVETRYGGNIGKNRAIDALAAMGFDNPRRGKYFRSELESYLLMTRQAGLDPLKPMASYAGALGLCQFMPSNIKRYGVDFDGRGGVNLWTPHDAIASVANYFSKHGWRPGGTVAVPAMSTSSSYKTLRTGFKSNHSLSHLKRKGVVAGKLGNISGKASLIKLDTYDGDELWLGGKNFYVITRYNHSSHYAMAVHQLAQAIKSRIGGRGVIRQASLDSRLNAL